MNQPNPLTSELIGDLTYINYAHNRGISPEVSPERWAKIYGPSTPEMELRYRLDAIISGLTGIVERAELPDPRKVLVNARVHLCDQIMDEGDVQAWFELGDLQECLESGLDRVCHGCGEMEGLHRTGCFGGHVYCRKQSLFSGNQRLSHRFVTEGYSA